MGHDELAHAPWKKQTVACGGFSLVWHRRNKALKIAKNVNYCSHWSVFFCLILELVTADDICG